MNYVNIKEFKDKSNIEIIQKLLEINNGYITSKLLTELGIHRMYISIMKNKHMIEKVGNGIYMAADKFEDSYYVFSIQFPKVIFSHMTALFFHELSIKAPNDEYDITILNKYHNPNLKNKNIFYVSNDIYNLGITEVETPSGNKVKAYDMERCICDIIRSRKRMDIEHVKYSIREYLKRKNKNIKKLSEYANKMGIRKEVMDFVSMMYE